MFPEITAVPLYLTLTLNHNPTTKPVLNNKTPTPNINPKPLIIS